MAVYYRALGEVLERPYNVEFIRDLPNGDYLVQHNCGEELSLQLETPRDYSCPRCSGDLVFPDADW